MATQIPKIDARTAEEIASRVKQQAGLADAHHDPLGEALVRIFARYCELIIDRLNRVPEKNYRAFLNDLGVSRNPPIAARVPLTFTPVKSSANKVIVVPKYTKVTAPPGEGESAPVVFETTQDLTLTRAELHKMVALDTQEDRYTDLSALASPNQEDAACAFPFKGTLPVAHEFYIALEESLAADTLTSLQLFFSIGQQSMGSLPRHLQWRIKTDGEDQIIVPDQDTTFGLSHSGIIVFNNLPKWKMTNRGGTDGYWLSCHLLEPEHLTSDKARKISRIHLPTLSKIEITGYANIEDAKIESAFFNALPVDLSKDFYPLGERPQFGDVLYLNSTVFTKTDTEVTLDIKLTNPASGKKDPPIRRANQSGKAVLRWEYWNGGRWELLTCTDGTQALTEDGTLSFSIPQTSQKTLVNGLPGDWLRVRLISGHYGIPESIQFNAQQGSAQGIHYMASTLAPPAIASISIRSSKKMGPIAPQAVITHNDFIFETIDLANIGTFTPFQVGYHPIKALYFGFTATDKGIMAGRWLDLYVRIGHSADKIVYRGDQLFPTVSWQCWNGKSWEACNVKDETQSFNVTGVISLLLPDDIACWDAKATSMGGDDSLYWVRAIWLAGEFQCKPVLRHVLLNTTLAMQAVTLENEILGSGNGSPNQVFYSARTPILDKLILEVREPQIPAGAELARIARDEGNDAIEGFKDGQTGEDIWVRWHEVDDFLESDHSDRHFMVERLSGEIRFGNGLKGMLPPSGANNIRLRSYKTGGGTVGNKPINSIAQLRSSLPMIASVVNPEAAYGGLDIEGWDSVYFRGSRKLRHRGLAITAEDYQDIAKNGSPEVARAKCYPLRDLELASTNSIMPGVVSLVIVPNSTQPAPRPTLDLLRRTWKYIDPLRVQGTTLIVLGPEYVRINVAAVIVPSNEAGESDIAMDCRDWLDVFLHPLTGGARARGWDFGAIPHQSDLFALLESVPGLEYVRSLQIDYEEERPGLLDNGNFLICSGKHRIKLA